MIDQYQQDMQNLKEFGIALGIILIIGGIAFIYSALQIKVEP